ncbi:MAG: CDGSH iron-sulfur domain-containing protein [Bacteroidales bacterium]|nr:CDGSH iron-sulfur domain-containing protein [Bacteroidales bacterium]
MTNTPKTPNIIIIKKGPIKIEGPHKLNGITKDVSDEEIYLCRCGHSNNQPYCDGSHSQQEWPDNEGF